MNPTFYRRAQGGAAALPPLVRTIELLEESAQETKLVIQAYRDLLSARKSGKGLYRELHASSQVGVTSGTYSGLAAVGASGVAVVFMVRNCRGAVRGRA